MGCNFNRRHVIGQIPSFQIMYSLLPDLLFKCIVKEGYQKYYFLIQKNQSKHNSK
jgi:hypothetical protein